MSHQPAVDIHMVLVVKADRLYAESIGHRVLDVFPGARVMVAQSVTDAAKELERSAVDLLLSGVGVAEGDGLDLLADCVRPPRRAQRILVITGRREPRIRAILRALPIDGVFDSGREKFSQFAVALRAVGRGEGYWSPSMVEASPGADVSRSLTRSEELVFAVIGDGCDDMEAAARLGLSPATILSVRRELHRKLRIQHRGQLVRLAAQHGYVRFTPDGVVRPGFATQLAEQQIRRRKQERTDPGLSTIV